MSHGHFLTLLLFVTCRCVVWYDRGTVLIGKGLIEKRRRCSSFPFHACCPRPYSKWLSVNECIPCILWLSYLLFLHCDDEGLACCTYSCFSRVAFEVEWQLLCCKVLERYAFFSSPISGPYFYHLLRLREVFQVHMSRDFCSCTVTLCFDSLERFYEDFYQTLSGTQRFQGQSMSV